jgi:hypothetical protein
VLLRVCPSLHPLQTLLCAAFCTPEAVVSGLLPVTRVVPRAFWVCAQSAVLSQCSALFVSEKAHLLLFWLAELRPRRKTVKNIALGKKPPATPKESTQSKLNPVLRHNVLKRSSEVFQLAQSATTWTDDAAMWRMQRWRCDHWQLHANGVDNPGAQFDVPAVRRSIACERRWCLHQLNGWV